MVNKKEHCQRIASEKRVETFEKILKTLIELIEEQQSISLKIVREKSGVSQSWLYQNSEIKKLIEYLGEYSINPVTYLKNLEKRLDNLEKLMKQSVK